MQAKCNDQRPYKHLGRALDEIALNGGAREDGKVHLRADAVHDVAKLVEEGLHLVVTQ